MLLRRSFFLNFTSNKPLIISPHLQRKFTLKIPHQTQKLPKEDNITLISHNSYNKSYFDPRNSSNF